MLPITSSQNPRLKKAMRLHAARGRKQQSRIIIFGQREIGRAIDAGVKVVEIFVEDAAVGIAQPLVGRLPGCEFFSISEALMQRLQFGDRSEGLVAIAERPETNLSDFPTDRQAIVVLEQVEKPGNLGAIVRSIDACGNGGLILADPKCDAFHPNAIRSSTGATFDLPIATGTNEAVQNWLAERGYSVLTAFLEDAQDFFAQKLEGKVAIVLGNEANGLTDAWRGNGFQPVKLPMNGIADSLNVSVTASVMLYESMRQRDASFE